jgi:hypothetical protein
MGGEMKISLPFPEELSRAALAPGPLRERFGGAGIPIARPQLA